MLVEKTEITLITLENLQKEYHIRNRIYCLVSYQGTIFMLPILSFNIDYHILRHGKRDILGMVAGILYVLSVCGLSQSTPKTKTIVLKRGGRKKSHGIPTSEEKRVEKKRRYESASEVQKTR